MDVANAGFRRAFAGQAEPQGLVTLEGRRHARAFALARFLRHGTAFVLLSGFIDGIAEIKARVYGCFGSL